MRRSKICAILGADEAIGDLLKCIDGDEGVVEAGNIDQAVAAARNAIDYIRNAGMAGRADAVARELAPALAELERGEGADYDTVDEAVGKAWGELTGDREDDGNG